MSIFAVLASVAVLWMLIGPAVALVSAREANRRAQALSERLRAIEMQLAAALAGQATAAAPAAESYFEPPTQSPVEPSEASAVPDVEAAGEVAGPWTPQIPPASPLAGPEQPGESLEGRIGGRWSVLVGGLALALGAIFLVRYSIEQGLLGPGMRIALGFLLAAVLFGGGEALRRRDRGLDIPAFGKADVPAILTGAGAIAAFATIYAAYALYGFIGDAAAFVLLTAAGLAALFLSAVHGPALAALGVLGSYAAPLLVSSEAPKPFPVVLHILAVTAAVLAMARIRGWRWLAIAGIAASLAWGVLVGFIGNVNTTAAELLLVAAVTAIYVATLIAGTEPDRPGDSEPDWLGVAALAGVTALSVFYAHANPVYPPLISGILLAGALGATATRWNSAAPAVLISSILAVLTVMMLPASPITDVGTMRLGPLQWRILGTQAIATFALKATAIALVVGIGSFLTADREAAQAPRTAGLFAAAGASAPLLILVVVYLRHVPFETRPAVGIAALAMAGIFAAMAERIITRRHEDLAAPAPAFYAAGAVLALSLAMSVGLATRFTPLALSLGAAGVIWVYRVRPVNILPWLAVLCAGLACVALVAGPPLSPTEVGLTPVFNGLILRFGLPAGAILIAAEMSRRQGSGLPAALLQAIGLAVTALFVALEIRHFTNDGVFAAGVPGLGEQSALTMAALAFSLGLQRVARATGDPIYRGASLLAGVLGAAQIAVAHLITANPVFTNEHTGEGFLFNLLMPGYLLPAILAAWCARAARGVRPRWYVLLMAGLALALSFAYLTLTVRHAFQGPRLGRLSVEDAENWTYSAVWLLFGIALLATGIWRRSAIVRAASGVVIAVVVCKVFLLDMAALTGALRAASFLGLGAVLVVVGRIYQRLIARGPASPA